MKFKLTAKEEEEEEDGNYEDTEREREIYEDFYPALLIVEIRLVSKKSLTFVEFQSCLLIHAGFDNQLRW